MIDRRANVGTVTLVDILDRVLDKGLVVAGDIRISLANVELITIQVRLLVCSIDKAQEIGLDWWKRDHFLSSEAGRSSPADGRTAELEARVQELERQLTEATERPTRRRRSANAPRPETGEEHGG